MGGNIGVFLRVAWDLGIRWPVARPCRMALLASATLSESAEDGAGGAARRPGTLTLLSQIGQRRARRG
jgi:hypothetical protein